MYGGLGGLFVTAPLSCEVDTAALPDVEADRLRRLVEDSGLLGAEAIAPPTAAARDVFHYRLQIATAGGEYRYEFDDTNVPHRARPLLDRLTVAARAGR